MTALGIIEAKVITAEGINLLRATTVRVATAAAGIMPGLEVKAAGLTEAAAGITAPGGIITARAGITHSWAVRDGAITAAAAG